MARILKSIAVLLVLVLALVGASGYIIQYLLTGSSKDALIAELSRIAKVPVRVGEVKFDVAQWYKLQPALSLETVSIGNPPGFTTPNLVEAHQLSLRVAMRPLLDKKIQVQSIELIQPEVTIEKKKDGTSNLEAFLQGIAAGPSSNSSAQPADPSAKPATLSIDSLRVTGGEIRLVEAGSVAKRSPRLRTIDILLTEFAPGQPCKVDLSARLYDGTISNLKFAGQLGPFGSGSLPMDGKLTGLVALLEVPDAMRKVEFGTLLAMPGSKAQVAVDGNWKGDVFRQIDGQVRLTFSDVQLGRDQKHLLPLSGTAPAVFTVQRIMSNPSLDLKLRDASLRLGPGEWKGSFDLLVVGGVARGRSSGAFRNIDINEFLGAFTTTDAKVHGIFEIPAYNVHFGGNSAERIQSSLSGTGKIAVSKGRIQALDLLSSVRNAIEKPQADPTDTKGDTEFTTLKADLQLDSQKLKFVWTGIDGPALKGSGDGEVTFAQAVDFKLDMIVRGRVAELLGKPPGSEAVVTMKIKGTTANPRVYPDIKKLAINTGVNYAEKLLKEKVLKDKFGGIDIPQLRSIFK